MDEGGVVGTVLIDLSKAYDCLPHDLRLAKIAAYGCLKSLRLIHSYLSGRKQRVKVENILSTWLEVIMGVPQGSIFGPNFI